MDRCLSGRGAEWAFWMSCIVRLLGDCQSNRCASCSGAISIQIHAVRFKTRVNSGSCSRGPGSAGSAGWVGLAGRELLGETAAEQLERLPREGAGEDPGLSAGGTDDGRHLDVALPREVEDRQLHDATASRVTCVAEQAPELAVESRSAHRNPRGLGGAERHQ